MTNHTTGLVTIGNTAVADFFAMSPNQKIAEATAMAESLKSIVEQQKLFTVVGKGKHVHVEGWTTMGAFLGIVPKEREVRFENGDFIAYVDLINMRDGRVVGSGSAMCGKSEPTWASRPPNAQRSMAITRAVGKAYRLGFSWIMKLAGYEAAPAEEMDHVLEGRATTPPAPPPAHIFNARNTDDIAWLKANPAITLMDETTAKKVALEMHGRPKTDLDACIESLESQSRQSQPVQ